ncbi:hypothetical protein P3T27_002711 [Kitasatospora sp. MAA19]|uniref:hypothetical protein n=1 Tax=Kitasatospora sp. MAA19 TaxID=3035090 RepID=UPI002475EA2E|nr:hypothetical protein [Kitasatospora sp. MAA19]MDH6705988.1 hypothetical protein [Kitasatospora sp. MAA19]
MPAPRRRSVEETILQGAESYLHLDPEAPIYAELARIWQAAGRTVPGLPDPVWETLAAPGGT